MNGNTPDQAELKDLYEVFAGKTMLQNIRDTVARACTGYDYEDLKQEVTNPDNDGALEIDEIEEVDKTVTLLLHLFKYHLQQQPSSQAIKRAISNTLKNVTHIYYPPSGKEYWFTDGTFENSLTGATRKSLELARLTTPVESKGENDE